MIGVLSLAQEVGPVGLSSLWPLALAFVGGIGILAATLIGGRRFVTGRPSHGNVLDINAIGSPRAHSVPAPQTVAAPRRANAA